MQKINLNIMLLSLSCTHMLRSTLDVYTIPTYQDFAWHQSTLKFWSTFYYHYEVASRTINEKGASGSQSFGERECVHNFIKRRQFRPLEPLREIHQLCYI